MLHVERGPSIPVVAPQTYVMMRCERLGIYLRWSKRDGIQHEKPAKVKSWWGPIVHDRNMGMGDDRIRSDRCPVDIDEALETARCIQALPEELRAAVLEEHVIGGTQEEKAGYLEVHRTTLWRRCERAYPLLLELMNLSAAGLPFDTCNK